MAKLLQPAAFRGGNKSLTLNGKTFPVGPQRTTFTKPAGTGAIILNVPGTIFEGYDIHGRDVIVQADNVTIRHCSGDAAGLNTIWQSGAAKGLVVEFVILDSEGGVRQDQNNENFILSENGFVTVRNCVLIDAPVDCLNLTAGVVEHNAIMGAFYSAGAHSDAVSIHRTTGPVRVSENYIDFQMHKVAEGTNACIKVVSHFGPIVDVGVTGNVLLGGGFNAYVGDGGAGKPDKVTLSNNLMGLTEYGDKPEQFIAGGDHGTNFTMAGNSLFSAAPDGVVSVSGTAAPAPAPTPTPAPAPTPTPAPDPTFQLRQAMTQTAATLESLAGSLRQLAKQ